jgi:hypothetical protein
MIRYYTVTWLDKQGNEQTGRIEMTPHPEVGKVDMLRFYFDSDLSSYTNYLSGDEIACNYLERHDDRPGRRAKRFLKSIGLKDAVVTLVKEPKNG